MNKIQLINVDFEMDLCRLCYSEINSDLHRPVFSTENEPPFLNIIEKLIDLNISVDDPFSKVMCMGCYEKLKNFHEFLETIRETDAKFRQKFNNDQLVQVKKETDWEDEQTDREFDITEVNDEYYSATVKEEINTDQNDDIDDKFEDDNYSNTEHHLLQGDDSKIGKIKSYTCTYCWKVFKFKCYLKRHLQIHEKLSYTCNVCDREFLQASDLQEHKKLHVGDKPYECNVCQKRFPFKSYLKKHSNIHLDEKPYKCDICNREFVRTYNLNKHKKLHDRTYKCGTCDEVFLQFSELNNHKKVHSDKLYECKVCSKKFIFQGNLIRHSKIHTGKKSHQCNFCGKRFIQKCTLTRHLTLHGDNKQDSDVSLKEETEVKAALHSDNKPDSVSLKEEIEVKPDDLL